MKHMKISLATSTVVLVIQLKKHCIRDTLRVAERLKTYRLKTYRPNTSLPSTTKNLALVVKNDANTDFKVLSPCPIFPYFLKMPHKFYARLKMPTQT